MIAAADLDQLLLSFCDRRWLKVARIAGRTMDAIEAPAILDTPRGLPDQVQP